MTTRLLTLAAAIAVYTYPSVARGQTDSIKAAHAVARAEAALDSARRTVEAWNAKKEMARDHFDREPVGAGAPPLPDSIPFDVTRVPAHP
jgi:hypothetical protein